MNVLADTTVTVSDRGLIAITMSVVLIFGLQLWAPDCEGGILAFVRFDRPVFDMRTAMAVRADERLRKSVFHTRAWPAPNLAPWADGRGMIPFRPNRNSSM